MVMLVLLSRPCIMLHFGIAGLAAAAVVLLLLSAVLEVLCVAQLSRRLSWRFTAGLHRTVVPSWTCASTMC
jgi:membrane protein YdbS with pleckstrin-like domain